MLPTGQPKWDRRWVPTGLPYLPLRYRLRFLIGAVGPDMCRPAHEGADMCRPGLSGPEFARRGTPRAARLCRYQICSSGIFRSPPREDAELQQLGAAVAENEEGEELGHREASVPPAYFELEDAILFAELDSMDNMLSAGGQLKFTSNPGGPTLTHLRQSWAATKVDLKLKPATVGLTDNDRFDLLVPLTGGGAREQLGLLQETLLQEVEARNESVQRECERTLLTYQRELAAYEALTEEEQAAEEQLEPPVEPVLSDSFIQPVARL
jgi:hypothetical protein